MKWLTRTMWGQLLFLAAASGLGLALNAILDPKISELIFPVVMWVWLWLLWAKQDVRADDAEMKVEHLLWRIRELERRAGIEQNEMWPPTD